MDTSPAKACRKGKKGQEKHKQPDLSPPASITGTRGEKTTLGEAPQATPLKFIKRGKENLPDPS